MPHIVNETVSTLFHVLCLLMHFQCFKVIRN